MKHGLRDVRVIDFSSEIAGPYLTKLFADAGADVIKVEAPEGDPLRSWSASGADLEGGDGAFFQFLNTSKRSVVRFAASSIQAANFGRSASGPGARIGRGRLPGWSRHDGARPSSWRPGLF